MCKQCEPESSALTDEASTQDEPRLVIKDTGFRGGTMILEHDPESPLPKPADVRKTLELIYHYMPRPIRLVTKTQDEPTNAPVEYEFLVDAAGAITERQV